MQEIVINTDYGGFGLSRKAVEYLGLEYDEKLGDKNPSLYAYYGDEERSDPKLVECVKTLGRSAGGPYSSLAIIKIPDGVDWEINNCDGIESVREKSREWRWNKDKSQQECNYHGCDECVFSNGCFDARLP